MFNRQQRKIDVDYNYRKFRAFNPPVACACDALYPDSDNELSTLKCSSKTFGN